MTTDTPHILLTSLGTIARDTEYKLYDKTVKASLAPLALVQLIDPSERPTRVIAMVTKGAETTTWPKFSEGICNVLGFEPEAEFIPDGVNSEEVSQIIEIVAKLIPSNAKLTLDVTQGFRHFPFIFYALTLYLTSLNDVKLSGAYYGMVEAPDTLKPIIDLQPLLELPEWFHAVRVFRDQGTTAPMKEILAKKLEEIDTRLPANRGFARAIKGSANGLEKYAFAYESALPLELGKASKRIIDLIGQLATMNEAGAPPLAGELVKSIIDAAQKTAFVQSISSKGKWKKKIALDKNELDRQAQMIDLYLQRDQLSLAMGLMREWIVSWAIWKADQAADTKDWLTERGQYERRLGSLGSLAQSKAASPAQKEFGTFWNRLTNELRNALSHHAMRDDAIEEPPSALQKVRDFWQRLKEDKIDWPELGGGGGLLLLSPQGTKPGVLFSALKIAEPDRCLVICSGESANSIADATNSAGFKGTCKSLNLADPFGGFAEIGPLVEKAQSQLLAADAIIANMTGGTTLMGIVVQKLVEKAQGLDRPVRRLALIDRRSPAEQDRDPFVQGECHWLDEV